MEYKPILLSPPHLEPSAKEVVLAAIDSNWIAPFGPQVDQFEKNLSDHLNGRSVLATSSGTAAIHLGLRALGVGRDDYVLCSSLTFAASATPILFQNAKPIFIDSDLETWNMCPIALEKALESLDRRGLRARAMVVVNLYGQSADMDKIMGLARKFGVKVLEDAAESLGSTYHGSPSGTFGDISTFSFNGNKIITTSSGGALSSSDFDLVQKARYWSQQAKSPLAYFQHNELGYNYGLSNLLAALGIDQLRVLSKRVQRRREIFKIYQDRLADLTEIEWMPEASFGTHNRWLSVFCLHPEKSKKTAFEVLDALVSEKIMARPVMKPMHLQPLFSEFEFISREDHRDISSRLFESGVCLPSGSNLTVDEIERVISTLRKILGEK